MAVDDVANMLAGFTRVPTAVLPDDLRRQLSVEAVDLTQSIQQHLRNGGWKRSTPIRLPHEGCLDGTWRPWKSWKSCSFFGVLNQDVFVFAGTVTHKCHLIFTRGFTVSPCFTCWVLPTASELVVSPRFWGSSCSSKNWEFDFGPGWRSTKYFVCFGVLGRDLLWFNYTLYDPNPFRRHRNFGKSSWRFPVSGQEVHDSKEAAGFLWFGKCCFDLHHAQFWVLRVSLYCRSSTCWCWCAKR